MLQKDWVCFHCCSPTSGMKRFRDGCDLSAPEDASAFHQLDIEIPQAGWGANSLVASFGWWRDSSAASRVRQEAVVKARFHKPASAVPGIQHPVLLFPCKNESDPLIRIPGSDPHGCGFFEPLPSTSTFFPNLLQCSCQVWPWAREAFTQASTASSRVSSMSLMPMVMEVDMIEWQRPNNSTNGSSMLFASRSWRAMFRLHVQQDFVEGPLPVFELSVVDGKSCSRISWALFWSALSHHYFLRLHEKRALPNQNLEVRRKTPIWQNEVWRHLQLKRNGKGFLQFFLPAKIVRLDFQAPPL